MWIALRQMDVARHGRRPKGAMIARGIRKRRARGFTLMELMVVVVLVAILAMLAAPSMTRARNDRLVFDYARQTSSLFHEGRARSFGRGAAHLVLFSTDPGAVGARGVVYVFEALDGASTPGPSATCRSTTQWAWAKDFVPGVGPDAANRSRMVDFLNINATNPGAVQVVEDVKMEGATIAPDGTRTVAVVIAMCTTPSGTTFVGTGATAGDAIAALAAAEPFTGILGIDVARHRGATIVGLNRRVLLAGAGAPRILSL